ncbi:MAG: sodium:calcium antiporter [Candidatus Caldipriscus sp.]|jgi:cation:H+ antiporter
MIVLLFSLILGALSAYSLKLIQDPILTSVFGGLAIMSSGYILSVAVEAAQKDVSRSLATIVLALLAVLPEYAVDIYLAYKGAQDPAYIQYASANMTGANRLLLGTFWPITVFVAVFLSKGKDVIGRSVIFKPTLRLEIFFLFIVTLYSFKIPIMGEISILDSIILISIFLFYAYVSAKSPEREEEFEGVAEVIVKLRKSVRIPIVIFLFAFAGFVIFLSVKPFVHGLIETGKMLGISEFLLIQWVAPFASEMPELVAAIMLALKGKSSVALGALISSKVNQWSLLIGMLPLAYSFGLLRFSDMPLDMIQREEIFLTAAQSLFGTIIIANLKLSVWEGLWLFSMFFAQFLIPIPEIRFALAILYLIFSLILLVLRRAGLRQILQFARNIFE